MTQFASDVDRQRFGERDAGAFREATDLIQQMRAVFLEERLKRRSTAAQFFPRKPARRHHMVQVSVYLAGGLLAVLPAEFAMGTLGVEQRILRRRARLCGGYQRQATAG